MSWSAATWLKKIRPGFFWPGEGTLRLWAKQRLLRVRSRIQGGLCHSPRPRISALRRLLHRTPKVAPARILVRLRSDAVDNRERCRAGTVVLAKASRAYSQARSYKDVGLYNTTPGSEHRLLCDRCRRKDDALRYEFFPLENAVFFSVQASSGVADPASTGAGRRILRRNWF